MHRSVFHRIHKGVGRKVAGPEQAPEHDRAAASDAAPPPGHFVTEDLESDCARFLQQVRELARRRADALA
jgi:hypothetical protein